MLLFSARRGRPRHERSQRLRIQTIQYGLFWMGADDRVSEKLQTRAAETTPTLAVACPRRRHFKAAIVSGPARPVL